MSQFGYSTIGGTANSGLASNAYQAYFKHPCTYTGNVATVNVYMTVSGGPAPCTMGLYADSSGPTGAPLAVSAEVSVPNGTGWVAFTFSSPPSVTLGASYWFSIGHGSGSVTFYSDAGPGGGVNFLDYQAVTYSSGAQVNPAAAASYDGFEYSVYGVSGATGLTSGTASTVSQGNTVATVTCTAATGGTPGYTYQWKRSTTSGSGYTNVSGATSLTLNDTGLTNGTTYYYVCVATDSASATVTSGETPATPTNTHTYDLTDATIGGVGVQIEGGMTLGTWHSATAWGGNWYDQAIRFKGTFTGLEISLWQSGSLTTPVRVAIDGVDQAVVTVPTGSGYAYVSLGSGFDGAAEHTYLVSCGGQLYVNGVRTTNGTINTARLQARPVLTGYGDSILEGVSGGVADSTLGILHKAGLLLDYQVVNRGIFGTTVSNTVGTAALTGQNRTADITGLLPPASVIVVLYGVNDLDNSVSGATFTAAYLDMLRKLQDGCPGTPILCERLLKQSLGDTTPDAFSADIAADVAAMSNPRITSRSGMWSAYDGSAGIHPDGAHCTLIAAGLATDINAVLSSGGSAVFAPIGCGFIKGL